MSKPVAAIEPATAMRLPIGPPADGRPRRGTARPIVRIHLLGAMRATTYLGDDVLPRGRKARAILGYLCLAAGERVPRAHLATMLWGRLPRTGDRDRAKLNQALSRISTAFGPLADELIIADRETVALDAGL